MKKIKAIILVLVMVVSMLAVPMSISSTASASTKKVSLSKTSVTMNIGQTKIIKLKNNTSKVTWSVSNAKIKLVSKNKKQAKIKAVKAGTATLKAKVGAKTYKCKVTINKSYLDSTSETLNVGDSTTIKLVNNAASVKWSTSNSKIKIVSSSKKKAKIQAVSAGTSVLKAKVGTKTYKCKITIEKVFSATTDDIKYETYDTGTEIAGVFKNNSSETVSMDVEVVYYDASGNILDYSTDFNYCFAAGKECALYFGYPCDSNYNEVSFDTYKVIVTIEKSIYDDYSGKITVDANKGSDSVMATVTNNSGKDLEFINISVLYYDESNNVIGYGNTYAECETSGSTDIVSFDYPYDSEYETIEPASFKVYVNYAY